MDLRGIAKLSNDRWIICGGMDSSQVVRNRTFLLENTSLDLMESDLESFVVKYVDSKVIIESPTNENATLVDLSGKLILSFEANTVFKIDASTVEDGVYLFNQGQKIIRLKL